MANSTEKVVAAENTTTEVKLPWYKRLWYNRKVRTGLKIAGGVAGAGACALGGFALGKHFNPNYADDQDSPDDDED